MGMLCPGQDEEAKQSPGCPAPAPLLLVTPLPPPKSAAVPQAELGSFPVLLMGIAPNVGAAGSQLKK